MYFRRTALLLALLLATASATLARQSGIPAQERPPADPADVRSPDAIITALYACISGPIGQERQFDRLRSLYHPQAHVMHTQWRPGGEEAIVVASDLETYIGNIGYTVTRGFTEREIGRTVESFGTVTHVFSTYAYETEDGSMEGRGINSFQLFFDGTRYWIMSVIWSQETPEYPLPRKYIDQ